MDWSFRISWGLVHSVCILPGHSFPREKIRRLLSSRKNGVWIGQVNIKQEFWIPVCAKFICMEQLTALKTATFPWSLSILSSEMCSSGNGTRSGRRSGKYYSIRHMKISENQTGIFGRMERAHHSRNRNVPRDLSRCRRGHCEWVWRNRSNVSNMIYARLSSGTWPPKERERVSWINRHAKTQNAWFILTLPRSYWIAN